MNAPYNRTVGTFRRYFFAIASVALAIVVLELLGPTVNGATAAQILLLVLIIDARFWAALHFRHADVHAVQLATSVANYAAANYFAPVGNH